MAGGGGLIGNLGAHLQGSVLSVDVFHPDKYAPACSGRAELGQCDVHRLGLHEINVTVDAPEICEVQIDCGFPGG